MELSDEQIERLSIAVLAICSELERTGELMPREQFEQEFKEDYDEVLSSLKNEDLYPEPASNSWGNSSGVLFKPGNRSTRYSLEVH